MHPVVRISCALPVVAEMSSEFILEAGIVEKTVDGLLGGEKAV